MMWKILIAEIWEEVCYSLVYNEFKGCHKGTRGTGDLLYMFKESNVRRKTVPLRHMTYITAKRPMTWIIDDLNFL